MFIDESAVARILKTTATELVEKAKENPDISNPKAARSLTNLCHALSRRPELFRARVDAKGKAWPYDPKALRQAVYRILRTHGIALSKEGIRGPKKVKPKK